MPGSLINSLAPQSEPSGIKPWFLFVTLGGRAVIVYTSSKDEILIAGDSLSKYLVVNWSRDNNAQS